jgi:hypothetical protein
VPLLDPRLWNLIPSSLLLASACQVAPSIPVGETGTEDASGDGDPIGDGDGDGDDDCDCEPGEVCYSGMCYPGIECYDADQCEIGQNCFSNLCTPFSQLPECAAPELFEIPLPDAARGEILDLEFVDVDADGLDELLLLKVGELLVVHDDQSMSSTAVDPLSEALAVVRADGDAHLDVILTASMPSHGSRLLGNGDGTFAAAVNLAMPALLQPQAVHWPTADTQAMVALDFITRSSVMLTELANNPPSMNAFPVQEFVDGNLDAIHAADLDGDGDGIDAVLLVRECLLSYQFVNKVVNIDIDAWPSELCHAHIEPLFDPDRLYTFVFVDLGTETAVVVFNHFLSYAGYIGGVLIPGSVSDVAGISEFGLVLVGPEGTRLLEPDQPFDFLELECIANLDALPIADRVISGNFTDAAGDELALLGQGQLSVWSR